MLSARFSNPGPEAPFVDYLRSHDYTLTVGDSGRYARLHFAAAPFGAGAVTGRTRIGHDHASATADAAWRREREQTLVVVDDTTSAAVRTHDGLRARPRTAAVAGRALGIAARCELTRRAAALVGSRMLRFARGRPSAQPGGSL